LLPVHFLIAPIQGAVVNWAGHKYGSDFGNQEQALFTKWF